jgi:hypothetical protein
MDIDSIDITDSAFSLDVPTIATGGSNSPIDYTMFIYIGIAVIVLIVGFFIYKNYRNKQNVMAEDCQGGFCNMNDDYNKSPEINDDNQYENQDENQ